MQCVFMFKNVHFSIKNFLSVVFFPNNPYSALSGLQTTRKPPANHPHASPSRGGTAGHQDFPSPTVQATTPLPPGIKFSQPQPYNLRIFTTRYQDFQNSAVQATASLPPDIKISKTQPYNLRIFTTRYQDFQNSAVQGTASLPPDIKLP